MISRRTAKPEREAELPEAPLPCPVCQAGQTAAFFPNYRLCPRCAAVFLIPELLPDQESERKRYLLHQNNPGDPGYRKFLFRLAEPLLRRLPPGREGLDYGCGPGPALAQIFCEAGHRVSLYDPCFSPNRAALKRSYDFITCSETAEHFHRPAGEFARLDRLLRPGGLLGVMTAFRPETPDFAAWYYRRDPTHVVFYREETFRYLAGRFGWTGEFPAPDIFIGEKKR